MPGAKSIVLAGGGSLDRCLVFTHRYLTWPTTVLRPLESWPAVERDQHPEKEVEVWERIAKMYQLFLTRNPTDDLATKTEVFWVLLGASIGTEDFGESVCHLARERNRSSARPVKGSGFAPRFARP